MSAALIRKKDDSSAYVVIGLGNIGYTIYENLERLLGRSDQIIANFSWQNIYSIAPAISQVIESIENKTGKIKRICILWSAGISGPASPAQDTSNEVKMFKIVFSQLVQSYGDAVELAVISSLGGIFDDGIVINKNLIPAPHSCYGQSKLEIEKVACSLAPTKIYRISSVFSHYEHHRKSLIGSIIQNTIKRQPVLLFAHPHTQRDFVYLPLIADYISRDLINLQGFGKIQTLASGMSLELSTVIIVLEKYLSRKILVHYLRGLKNSYNVNVGQDVIAEKFIHPAFEQTISLAVARSFPGSSSF